MMDFKQMFSLLERIDPQYRQYKQIVVMLNEDKRTKQADNRTLQVIRDFYNNADWLEQTNEQGFTNIQTLLKQFKDVFYHNPQMKKGQMMRLQPLFCKLALENGFGQENPDNQKLTRLENIMLKMQEMSANNEINLETITDFNITFEQLDNQFGTLIDKDNAEEEERMNQAEYEINPDYKIIGPVDYETAHKYGDMSCPFGKLCYTQSEGTWNQYSRNRTYNVYIIVKKGFESIPAKHDDESGSPYDTYGLSMIFVFVDENGELAYCNTRWNHNANYGSRNCDHAMTKEEISDLIGVNFNNVFKASKKWNEYVKDVIERLANGENPYDIFDIIHSFHNGIAPVRLAGKWNYLNTNKVILNTDLWFDFCHNFEHGLGRVFLYEKGLNIMNVNGDLLFPDTWFNDITSFHNGLAMVRLDGRTNFLNKNGEFISEWFDEMDDFQSGFARVRSYQKGYNFIDTNGNLLFPDLWFNDASRFICGFSYVYLNNKKNCINSNGDILSPDLWFDAFLHFNNGFASVYIREKGWNFINENGDILSPDLWFDDIYGGFYDNDYTKVEKNKQYNILSIDGNLISPDLWFDDIETYLDYDYCIVSLKGKGWNFINGNGELLSDDWFDYVSTFEGDFATVEKEEKCNFIDMNGELLSNEWFDDIETFDGDFAKVFVTGKGWNNINKNGKILSPNLWFDEIGRCKEGFIDVYVKGMGCNFINKNGELLSNEWFDYVSTFKEGFARVRLNQKGYNFIDTNGNLLFSDLWFKEASDFYDGFAGVKTLNGEYYFINTKGKLIEQT